MSDHFKKLFDDLGYCENEDNDVWDEMSYPVKDQFIEAYIRDRDGLQLVNIFTKLLSIDLYSCGIDAARLKNGEKDYGSAVKDDLDRYFIREAECEFFSLVYKHSDIR